MSVPSHDCVVVSVPFFLDENTSCVNQGCFVCVVECHECAVDSEVPQTFTMDDGVTQFPYLVMGNPNFDEVRCEGW